MAGFLAGLVAILANPKAILFYMGMLPGFFDLTRITALDIVAIAGISTLVPLVGKHRVRDPRGHRAAALFLARKARKDQPDRGRIAHRRRGGDRADLTERAEVAEPPPNP